MLEGSHRAQGVSWVARKDCSVHPLPKLNDLGPPDGEGGPVACEAKVAPGDWRRAANVVMVLPRRSPKKHVVRTAQKQASCSLSLTSLSWMQDRKGGA